MLSKDHDSESVHIGSTGSLLSSKKFLSSLSGIEFGIKIKGFGGLGKSSSSATSEDWDSELCKGESAQWIDHSWEVLKSINQYSKVVNHINNNYKLAVVSTVINETNSTCFNEISKTLKSSKFIRFCTH